MAINIEEFMVLVDRRANGVPAPAWGAYTLVCGRCDRQWVGLAKVGTVTHAVTCPYCGHNRGDEIWSQLETGIGNDGAWLEPAGWAGARTL